MPKKKRGSSKMSRQRGSRPQKGGLGGGKSQGGKKTEGFSAAAKRRMKDISKSKVRF